MGNDLWADHSSPSERRARLGCVISPRDVQTQQLLERKVARIFFNTYCLCFHLITEHCVSDAFTERGSISHSSAARPSLVHRRKMMIRRLPSIYHRGGRGGGGEDVGFAPLSVSRSACRLLLGTEWSEKLGRIRISCREKKRKSVWSVGSRDDIHRQI